MALLSTLRTRPAFRAWFKQFASVTGLHAGQFSESEDAALRPHPQTQSPMGLICLAIAVEHWNLRCSWSALSSLNICLQCGHFTLPSSLIPTCSRVPLPDTASLLISMVSGMAAGAAIGQRRVTTPGVGHLGTSPC